MAAKSSKPRPSYRVHASPKALPSMHRPALPARRAPVFRLLPARCLRGWAAREGALAGARRAHRAPAHAPSAAHLACKIRHARQARPCPCPLPVSRPAPPTSRLRHRGGKFVANKVRFDGNLCCPVTHELSIVKERRPGKVSSAAVGTLQRHSAANYAGCGGGACGAASRSGGLLRPDTGVPPVPHVPAP